MRMLSSRAKYVLPLSVALLCLLVVLPGCMRQVAERKTSDTTRNGLGAPISKAASQEPASPEGVPNIGTPISTASVNGSGLKVSLLLEGRKAGKQWNRLESGAALQSGDALRIRVRLTAPAFIYVVQFFSNQTATVLFPPPPELQRLVPAGVEVFVPDAGFFFELDGVPGQEHVYVIASVRPLKEVDPSLVSALDVVRVSGSAAPPAASPGVNSEADTTHSSTDTTISSPQSKDTKALPPPTKVNTKDSTRPPHAGTPGGSPKTVAAQDTKTSDGSKSPSGSPGITSPAQQISLKTPPHQRKELVAMSMRGLELKADARAEQVSMVYSADGDGVAVLHFELEHLP